MTESPSSPRPAPRTDGGRSPVATDEKRPTQEQLHKELLERERQMARTRGVDDDDLDRLAENTIWVHSNRKDDRVVLWERDPRHPGGEVVVGPSPVRAFKTSQIQQRLFSLEIKEVPEPKRTMKIRDEETGEEIEVMNRKYPPDPGPDPAVVIATQPGRAIPIGRKLDPDLYDEDQRKAHERDLRGMPSELPVPNGTVVGGA